MGFQKISSLGKRPQLLGASEDNKNFHSMNQNYKFWRMRKLADGINIGYN